MNSLNSSGVATNEDFDSQRANSGLAVLRLQGPGEHGAVNFVTVPIETPFGSDFDSVDSKGRTFYFELPWGIRLEGFGFRVPKQANPGQKFDQEFDD
jgi:hypothetical protein